jgi:anti-sigma factor RsiW
MRCDRDLLSLFVDGELSADQLRRLSLHLKECVACRVELAEIRRINDTLYSWGSVRRPIPAETERRVRASVAKRKRLARVQKIARFSPPAVGSSIAALLLLVTVNLGPLYQSASPARPAPTQVSHLIKRQSAPLQLARGRAAVVTTQPDALHRLMVRRHIEALIN